MSNGPGVERAMRESGILRNTKNDQPVKNNVRNSERAASSTASASSVHMTPPEANNGGGVKRSGSYGKNQGLDTGKKVPKWFKPSKPNQQ